MRILQITSGVNINGATYHCLLLIRELVRRGHQVTLMCRPGAWISDQLAGDPVDVFQSQMRRWPLDDLRRMLSVLEQKQIELIHTHMSRAHFFGVMLRWFGKVPCVATAHSRHVQLHWMFNDLVIAVSDATRRFHQSYNLVHADRIVTIHNFVDGHQLLDPPGDVRSTMRASLGVDDQTCLIGAIGNVIPRKDQLLLVRALPSILSNIPRVRLVIIGSLENGEYVRRVKSLAEQLGVDGRITWAGQRDDVNRILPALDVSVLASREESMPLAILESMAAGLPVVATDVGGLSECIRSGRDGLLVPSGSRRHLAAAVSSLLLDPARRQRLGHAARRRVRDNFSSDGQTTAIETAFQRVARHRRVA